MGLFTPAYYSKKKSFDENKWALRKEKNQRRLAKAATDRDRPLSWELRDQAFGQLRSPGADVCEAFLMLAREQSFYRVSYSYLKLTSVERAAKALAAYDERRLEKLLRKEVESSRFGVESSEFAQVVLDHIKDPALLEAIAFNADGAYSDVLVVPHAIDRLQDENALARVAMTNADNASKAAMRVERADLLRDIALNSASHYARRAAAERLQDESEQARLAIADAEIAVSAAAKVESEELLRDIALQSPSSLAKVVAAARMKDRSAILKPLKAALMPELQARLLSKEVWTHVDVLNATKLDWINQLALLSVCGDKAARVLLYCWMYGERYSAPGCEIQNGKGSVSFYVLAADAEILYPALKNLIDYMIDKADGYNLRWQFEEIAWVVRTLHANNVKAEQIEAELPRTYKKEFSYKSIAGDDYDSMYTAEDFVEVRFW